jgi:glyceraldehyde-3-phosphate dehydrogenase/erythrose-4-phosphate dehydrogenase
MNKTRVAINGYGVIGKRIADAVLLQPDMELAGIADIVTDWRIRATAGRFILFASTDEAHEAMGRAGLPVAGTLDDLLGRVDAGVAIDAIRALAVSAPDAVTSMTMTDSTLGMRRDFLAQSGSGAGTVRP